MVGGLTMYIHIYHTYYTFKAVPMMPQLPTLLGSSATYLNHAPFAVNPIMLFQTSLIDTLSACFCIILFLVHTVSLQFQAINGSKGGGADADTLMMIIFRTMKWTINKWKVDTYNEYGIPIFSKTFQWFLRPSFLSFVFFWKLAFQPRHWAGMTRRRRIDHFVFERCSDAQNRLRSWSFAWPRNGPSLSSSRLRRWNGAKVLQNWHCQQKLSCTISKKCAFCVREERNKRSEEGFVVVE